VFRYIIRTSPDGWFKDCSGARRSGRRSTSTIRKHVDSYDSSRRVTVPLHVSGSVISDQQLRETDGRWRVWVSLSRSTGIGDTCCREKVRARCGGRRRIGDIYDRSNVDRDKTSLFIMNRENEN
jgi:hypothetical protein